MKFFSYNKWISRSLHISKCQYTFTLCSRVVADACTIKVVAWSTNTTCTIVKTRLAVTRCYWNSKYSNMTPFFRFVNKRAIYRLGIISLAHAPVYVTDFPVVNVHVDELSSAQIWQHKLYATLSANVNINYRLPIKVFWLGIKY
jgi:hypothetical protein